MPQLTISEQARVVRLAAGRMKRGAVARVLSSPLLRWRYGAPVADELLIIPQDLRTADPSFASELVAGQIGLAGRVASLSNGTPFDLRPPSDGWARELHGFAWLRHLKAAQHDTAVSLALKLTGDWITVARSRTGIAWEPAVIGRRLISWITNASLLLEQVDQVTYDRTADCLADQLIHLSSTWRDAPDGFPRLLAITALAYGDLCIAGHDRHLGDVEPLLSAELERQILPDGGHINRNPAALVELLLDLLPLRQCFIARDRKVPAALDAAIGRMLPMLRFMRLGDGTLARFNGMGAPSIDGLATVLAYDGAPTTVPEDAPHSGYARLQRGGLVLICDVGSPPPIEVAGRACAGCLSFELSAGYSPVFVNGGAPGPTDDEWRAQSRATSSHNTLCLGTKSSSKLVRHPILERLVGAPPIRFPNRVTHSVSRGEDGDVLDASHDGYMRVFELMHLRTLKLSADGQTLDGYDRLKPQGGELRLKQDVPFAVHFHLHPEVEAAAGESNTAVLRLRDGSRWQFQAAGAELSLEPSVHFADISGPARSVQIALRAATFGDSEIRWQLQALA